MSTSVPVPRAARSCGHFRHVGTCPPCQRAQLARWTEQLRAVTPPARSSAYQPATELLLGVVHARPPEPPLAER